MVLILQCLFLVAKTSVRYRHCIPAQRCVWGLASSDKQQNKSPSCLLACWMGDAFHWAQQHRNFHPGMAHAIQWAPASPTCTMHGHAKCEAFAAT